MSVDEEAYKKAKELFVSGHNGTSVGEVALVLSVLSTSLWFYSELMVVVEKLGLLGKSKLQRTLSLLVIEFVLLVLPILISFTFTEFTLPITLVFAVGAIALGTLSWRHASESDKKLARKDKLTFLMSTEKPAVTCFRAQMMICTCVAILAVDFTIFPRRFAKTETFGVSLMDSGVGLFIMSSALTSAYARGAVAKRASSSFSLRAIWLFLRPMLPVLVLGVIRYVSVKKVNYQEHVTEYGVHWNFYFTLASLYLTFSLLALFGSIATSVPVALLLLAGYQVGLTSYGIADFIFHAPRVDLFSQNREGIFSLCGSPFISSTTRFRLTIIMPRVLAVVFAVGGHRPSDFFHLQLDDLPALSPWRPLGRCDAVYDWNDCVGGDELSDQAPDPTVSPSNQRTLRWMDRVARRPRAHHALCVPPSLHVAAGAVDFHRHFAQPVVCVFDCQFDHGRRQPVHANAVRAAGRGIRHHAVVPVCRERPRSGPRMVSHQSQIVVVAIIWSEESRLSLY
ncbi:hypothetical protein H257_00481 [Aphanomyces astaci]|uniref:GPI-anchored wall transfer protein 1 n=1 Tax=Aphanomyces astaci TaxID=112090 RepID=W4HCV2_APHAT|nr:hypothetical protein H257_00481 [Aphanomyces astaci]ETV89104.1 hypothetical protein H257_00481 [Aphanomyces astaci]|eukprot:XP_009821504.1 hypothetical protein H257_00481 [Aphanomyces astaci]